MIHGRNLILALDGTPLAGSKSCSVDMQQSFLQVASPTSGRWEESVPERLSWKITSDGLLVEPANFNTLKAAMDNGTQVLIRFYDTNFGINQSGYAYIESLDYAASVGSLARYSVSLRGTGTLDSYPGTEIAMEEEVTVQGYYYYTAAQNTATYDNREGYTICYTLTLTERTQVRFASAGCDFILAAYNSDIAQNVDHGADIDMQEYDATWYSGAQVMWMNAGEYSIVFTTDSHVMHAPKLYKLN